MRATKLLVLFIEFLSILITVDVITPVCFNCHCSTYILDRAIKCKDAVLNKTSYFNLWTKNMTVAEGSDVVLAAEVKAHSEQYCWCTDAKLEWNGLYQNSSGRLLVVNMKNVTKIETGHFWAVLYLHETFYFSDPLYLNVTGPNKPVPSPDLVVDPRMSALVVGILFVLIMFFGIAIYCCKMSKRRTQEKKMMKMARDLEAESRIPLQWELQDPDNIIQETDMELAQHDPVYGPEPRATSDLDEEGSCHTSSSKDTSPSITSEEQQDEVKPKDEEEVETPIEVKAVEPLPARRESQIQTIENARYPGRVAAFVPITDDRFTTERSWYKSLNTEIVSESLLSNKDREAKKEEKKRRKSLAKSDGIAQGILRCGDMGSGFMGSSSTLHQERVDRIHDIYQTLTRDFKYGRSLPTPQPAGARPTVMTIFPTHASSLAYNRAGVTIHSTNPHQHRHVQSLFNDTVPLTHKRSRSVQFSDNNITKRFHSADHLPSTPPSTKRNPKKSNLKSKKSSRNTAWNTVEVDGLTNDNPNDQNNSEKLESSGSDSSSSLKTDSSSMKTGSSSPAAMHLDVSRKAIPVLDLTPATPTQAHVNMSRFTVKRVDSEHSLDIEPSMIDPLLGGRCWDFSSEENCRENDTLKKMDHLTVPGPYLGSQQGFDGYWTS